MRVEWSLVSTKFESYTTPTPRTRESMVDGELQLLDCPPRFERLTKIARLENEWRFAMLIVRLIIDPEHKKASRKSTNTIWNYFRDQPPREESMANFAANCDEERVCQDTPDRRIVLRQQKTTQRNLNKVCSNDVEKLRNHKCVRFTMSSDFRV